MSDIRVYETTIEILFDFERMMNKRYTRIYFHFHKQSMYDNNIVEPYMIALSDKSTDKKSCYIHNDIINILHYIPVYKLHAKLQTDLNYIDIDNRIIAVPMRNDIRLPLLEYYNKYINSLTMDGKNNIDKDLINNVLELIQSEFSGLNIHVENDFVCIDKLNIVIPTKTTCNYDLYNNILKPDVPYELENSVCLGRFVKYNGRDYSNYDDVSLALLTACCNCDKSILINYYIPHVCPWCHTVNY